MNKLYQRINWQNYPSDSTPLNESNLNKMDAAVDGIDDRVVTLDVTKLPVATANTMVKDVTFNETTGVFTITKLNGTKVTVNTALEKIATNFRFDYSTQKLILTLIDGTTQEVDLSALLTQYEFLNSSTIQFTIDSSGKVKASVVNGSITGDMLEPNYLANVTLQASKADTSAKNAKESEEKASEYAESAKNSADSAEPVASTATGKNPTIQDSTNAPLIYGKFKGYTLQDGEPTPDNPVEINGLAKDGAIEVKTTGKNVFGGLALENKIVGVVSGATKNEETGSVQYSGSAIVGHMLFDSFKANTQYTFIFYGKNLGSYRALNVCIYYTDGTKKLMAFPSTDISHYVLVSDVGKTVEKLEGVFQDSTTLLYPNQCGIFEGIVTLDDFEPYKESTATIPTDAPLYEGDYLEVYADGSGKLVRDKCFATLRKSNFYKSNTYYQGTNSSLLPDYYGTTNDKTGKMLSNVCVNMKNPANSTEDRIWVFTQGLNATCRISESIYNTLTDNQAINVLYKRLTPLETPLTVEQVEQFKQLYTFEPVTNVLCDGEVEIRYYKANDNGETVGMLQGMVEKSNETVGVLQDEILKIEENFQKKIESKFIFIGDSYDMYSGWIDKCANLLNIKPENYHNIAKSGTGFFDGSFNTLLKNFRTSITEDYAKEITHIVVCGGVNDSTSTTDEFLEVIYNNIAHMAWDAETMFPNATIYLGYIGNALENSSVLGNRNYKNRMTLCAYWSGACLDHTNMFYLNNVEYALHNYSYMGEDGLHPNNNGGQSIARHVSNALRNGSADVKFERKEFTVNGNFDVTGEYASYVDNGITSITMTGACFIKNTGFSLSYDVWTDLGIIDSPHFQRFDTIVVKANIADNNYKWKDAHIRMKCENFHLYVSSCDLEESGWATHNNVVILGMEGVVITLPTLQC